MTRANLRHEAQSDKETAYLLRSEAMKRRLLEAKRRRGGMSIEEACARLAL